jgi:predicted flap endonuclease-1-like 5' DNA nuclease
MNWIFFWWFCFGALVGFGIEWIWDWLWFRRAQQAKIQAHTQHVQALSTERDRLHADLRICGERTGSLERELIPLRQQAASLATAQAQVAALTAEVAHLRTQVADVAAYQARISSLEQALAANQPERAHAVGQRDPLVDILGIGPVYAQRLIAAGITSFAQVADLSEAQLQAIIQPEPWQKIDFTAWIAEARQRAQQVQAGTYHKGSF